MTVAPCVRVGCFARNERFISERWGAPEWSGCASHRSIVGSRISYTPPSSSQPGSSRIFRRNADTILPGDPRAARLHVPWTALTAKHAYARASTAHRASPPPPEGHRLYVLDASLVATRDVTPDPHGHLVIGRHSRCDVVLYDAESVSLRHVLVRATTLDDGLPVVSVLDLDSAVGFELSDGSRERAVVASGPLAFRIGAHWLVALPSSGSIPDELPAPRIARVETSAYRVLTESVAGVSVRPLPGESSQITIVPASNQLSDFGSLWRSGGKGFEITLESRRRRASVHVFEREVEHGILVGRAPKCFDAGLQQVLNEGVSRVHVLIVRERGGVRLYDIASTNGTFSDGRRVRRVDLSDRGTRVQLAGNAPLSLTWRALSD